MLIHYHIWLTLAMGLIHWAKVYLIFQKKRADPEEKKIDLIVNCTFAILFTFAFMDLFFTLPEIMNLIKIIIQVVGD